MYVHNKYLVINKYCFDGNTFDFINRNLSQLIRSTINYQNMNQIKIQEY